MTIAEVSKKYDYQRIPYVTMSVLDLFRMLTVTVVAIEII